MVHRGVHYWTLTFAPAQGYSLGNAVTDFRYDGNALVPFARGHSLISPGLHADVERECGGEYWNASKGESRGPCALVA